MWTHLAVYQSVKCSKSALALKVEVVVDREEFVQFLASETRAHWEVSQQPLYLADIPSLLREKKSLDYKVILGDQRLKGFSEETSGSGSYQVVKHPIQKAKVGLIPPGEQFEFPSDTPVPYANLWRLPNLEPQDAKTSRVTLDFIKAISSLTPEEQASIIIPTHIIAKLLNQK